MLKCRSARNTAERLYIKPSHVLHLQERKLLLERELREEVEEPRLHVPSFAEGLGAGVLGRPGVE